MKVHCASCSYEINLDHRLFCDYQGPVRCFCCGSVMRLASKQGQPCSIEPLFLPERKFHALHDSIWHSSQ
jgi:hypothetical protein